MWEQLLRSIYKIGSNEYESIQNVAITLLANTALQHLGLIIMFFFLITILLSYIDYKVHGVTGLLKSVLYQIVLLCTFVSIMLIGLRILQVLSPPLL